MKLHLYFLIAFLILLTNFSKADQVDELVMQGLELQYDVKFKEAKSYFEQAIKLEPQDPRGHFFNANIHLWSYLFDNKDEQLAYFFTMSDKTISIAEKQLKNNPTDSRAKLFIGMSYGYRAIGNLRNENFVAAAMAGKTCYEKLLEVVKTNKQEWDAYLGLGIFHFIFGSIPEVGQVFTGLSGIKGDAKLGLQEILAVSAKGNYFKQDAKFINALLELYYKNERSKGIERLKDISKKYPNNVPINYVIGAAYYDGGEVGKSLEFFDKVIRSNNSDFKVFTSLSYARSGMAYFLQNNFVKAKNYFQIFLKNYNEKFFKTQTWTYLGLCYELEGNRENAMKAYSRAKEGLGKSGEDNSARIKAIKYYDKPLTPIDIEVLKCFNHICTENFELAEGLANKLLTIKNLGIEQTSVLRYSLGRVCLTKKNYKGAIDNFSIAVSNYTNNKEKWVAPYSYYYISESYKAMNDNEKAKEYLRSARNFKNYENEHLLRFKIERNIMLID